MPSSEPDIPTYPWWPAGCPVSAIEPDCGYCYGLLHRLARVRRTERGDAPATADGDASLQAFADGGGG